jgi:internalin A
MRIVEFIPKVGIPYVRLPMSRLMLCGVVSWLVLIASAPLCADDAEDKAVAFVEKLGGRVARDEKLPGKPVNGVQLSFSAVTDAGLKELAPLQNLTRLGLDSTKVTDAGLKELVTLKNLQELYLYHTQVTDMGLKELARLKNLTTLELTYTKVTNTGLKELAPLKNLTALRLSYTQVTDAGLKGLAAFENLEELHLAGTFAGAQVTDGRTQGTRTTQKT